MALIPVVGLSTQEALNSKETQKAQKTQKDAENNKEFGSSKTLPPRRKDANEEQKMPLLARCDRSCDTRSPAA